MGYQAITGAYFGFFRGGWGGVEDSINITTLY